MTDKWMRCCRQLDDPNILGQRPNLTDKRKFLINYHYIGSNDFYS